MSIHTNVERNGLLQERGVGCRALESREDLDSVFR